MRLAELSNKHFINIIKHDDNPTHNIVIELKK